jgi:hypothetical protein
MLSRSMYFFCLYSFKTRTTNPDGLTVIKPITNFKSFIRKTTYQLREDN